MNHLSRFPFFLLFLIEILHDDGATQSDPAPSRLMHPPKLTNELNALSKQTLARILSNIAVEHPCVVDRIRSASLAAEPAKLEEMLNNRINALQPPDDWLPDGKGEEYAQKWIDPIIAAVREELIRVDAAAASRILCRILTLPESFLERIDDSYDCVGLRMQWSKELLLTAARKAPEQTLTTLRRIQDPDAPRAYRKDALVEIKAMLAEQAC